MTHAFGPAAQPDQSCAARASATILQLETTLEQLRQQEMQRFQKKLNPAEAGRLDALSRALMQRYLQLPVAQLSTASQRGDDAPVVAMLTELFALHSSLVQA